MINAAHPNFNQEDSSFLGNKSRKEYSVWHAGGGCTSEHEKVPEVQFRKEGILLYPRSQNVGLLSMLGKVYLPAEIIVVISSERSLES